MVMDHLQCFKSLLGE